MGLCVRTADCEPQVHGAGPRAIRQSALVSRDLLVQDIPPDAQSTDDLVDGWESQPLRVTRSDIISAVPPLHPRLT